jgi:hypothetical protein
MKTLLVSLMAAAQLLAGSLYAQDLPEKKIARSGGGGLTIGYGFMDVSALHSLIPSYLPSFRNEFFVIGGSGHGMMNRFVIGGGGFGITRNAIRNDSMKVSLGGGVGTFDLGYLVVDRAKVKLYPMLGIGGGGFGLEMTRKGDVSADHLSSNPAREINISQGYFAVDLSLNLALIPVLEKNEKDGSIGGFMTGLKAGYIYSLPSSNWRFSGGDITGGPEFGMNLFYLKLIVGGFGYEK